MAEKQGLTGMMMFTGLIAWTTCSRYAYHVIFVLNIAAKSCESQTILCFADDTIERPLRRTDGTLVVDGSNVVRHCRSAKPLYTLYAEKGIQLILPQESGGCPRPLLDCTFGTKWPSGEEQTYQCCGWMESPMLLFWIVQSTKQANNMHFLTRKFNTTAAAKSNSSIYIPAVANHGQGAATQVCA